MPNLQEYGCWRVNTRRHYRISDDPADLCYQVARTVEPHLLLEV